MCDGKDEAVLAGKGTSSEEIRHLHSQSDFQGEGKISKAEEKQKDNEQRSKARPFSCTQICDSELNSSGLQASHIVKVGAPSSC